MVTPEDAEAMREMRASLVRRRPPKLSPGEGDQAFEEHQILAMAIHRAVQLTKTGDESETRTWVRYVVDYFPAGRNDPDDAKALWKDWRTSLVKKETPGATVSITHGQPHLHWMRNEEDGALVVNLEDLWDDFEASVEALAESLTRDAHRRRIVLKRWRERTWEVRSVRLANLDFSAATAASAASSISIVKPPMDGAAG